MTKLMNQTKVYKLLEKRESVFLNQVKDAINIADDMLPQINNVFNTYTIHGMKHSINVAEYMFDLIENAEEMSDLELVMIIYAALFHDSGMIVSDDEMVGIKDDKILLGNRRYSKVLEKYKNEKIALQECVRPVHGSRVNEFIEHLMKDNRKIFLIPETTNISFHKELALICQAHNEDFSWIANNLKYDTVKNQYYLNEQFIAVLLRIGDYLDIDEQRAPLYLYKYLKPNDYSNLEWQQHFVIENYNKIYINENTGLKEIVFQGQSDTPSVHRKLLKYFDGINSELLNAVSLCEKYEKKRYMLNLKTNIINKIYTTGFSFSDFKLSLDYNAVTNLLMGEHIYGNKKYGLREIIQNSIDACKTMQETAETHPDFRLQKYEPFIRIVIDKDRNQVTILDNGSGMSVDILKKYFLNVGVSYYKSDDYVLQGRKYSPIGHYGIGFLACFMLSDTVEVITRHFEENKVTRIEFEKSSEYICLTYEDKYKVQGTEIVLEYEQFMETFENNYNGIVRFIENNFLNCEIPIRIVIQENGQTEEKNCNLMKIKTVLENCIYLNDYLNGVEAYISCNYRDINFADKLEDLNGNKSYFYDSDNNRLVVESDSGINIRDCVKDEEINFFSVPIIGYDEAEEFEKAYDVLEDFEQALDKIDYETINILSIDCDEEQFEREIEDGDMIIGDYTFEDFCEQFEHCDTVQTHTFKEKYFIICNEEEKILPYIKGANFGGKYSFEQKDKTYIKNVLLSRLKVTIPFLVDGVILKDAIINITNDNFSPNVSRDNLNADCQGVLSYAIGKALHIWILENVAMSSEERNLLEKFIEVCYRDNNCCLKIK